MTTVRAVLDCASKAMVTVAVMLSVLILVGNPAVDTPARPLAAGLLALGTIGLVALHAAAGRAARH